MKLDVTALIAALWGAFTWIVVKVRDHYREQREQGRRDEATAIDGFNKLTEQLQEEILNQQKRILQLEQRAVECEEDRMSLHLQIAELRAKIELMTAGA